MLDPHGPTEQVVEYVGSTRRCSDGRATYSTTCSVDVLVLMVTHDPLEQFGALRLEGLHSEDGQVVEAAETTTSSGMAA